MATRNVIKEIRKNTSDSSSLILHEKIALGGV